MEHIDVVPILRWENNSENWGVSGTRTPFIEEDILHLVNTQQDIKINKQIRYMICLNSTQNAIGTLDLFEFNESNKIIGVGILIADVENRNKGYAQETINLIIDYCRNELELISIFCNILKDNSTSIRLFENCGFQFIEERELDEKKVNYYELSLQHV